MKTLGLSRVFCGAFGSLGIGVLLGGILPAANAGTVAPGTDYLVTPPRGARYTFPLPGGGSTVIEFIGLPIGIPTPNGPTPPNPDGGWGGYVPPHLPPSPPIVVPGSEGLADTVVNRMSPVDTMGTSINPITGLLDVGGSTPIEIVGLSLKSVSPVTLPGGLGIDPGAYDVYAGLHKYYGNSTGSGPASTGTMFIGDDPNNYNLPTPLPAKTWDSEFSIDGVAFFVPVDTAWSPDFVRSTLQEINTPYQSGLYACTSTMYSYVKGCFGFQAGGLQAFNEPWKETPAPGDLLGQNLLGSDYDFYLGNLDPIVDGDFEFVIHQAPNKLHIVKTPAPLPFLGASTAYAFARRLRKRCRKVASA